MTIHPFRRSKYRNTPTVVDGERFDSKAEAKRWGELRMLERAGIIRDLHRQVSFELRAENGFVVERYRCDFTYHEFLDGRWVFVVEDVKGAKTEAYKRKKRWMKHVHGIEIREVRA